MHYFRNKFSKIAKYWGHSTRQRPLTSILVTKSCVIWPNCVFSKWL